LHKVSAVTLRFSDAILLAPHQQNIKKFHPGLRLLCTTRWAAQFGTLYLSAALLLAQIKTLAAAAAAAALLVARPRRH
jgi:hypothetical protein